MRLDHITALTRVGAVHKATHNGALLISEGHFAVSVPPDFSVPEQAKAYDPLEKLWADALTVPKSPLPIGDCYELQYFGIVRKIGDKFVDQRYVYCFGESAEWTQHAHNGGTLLLVHIDGELVGIVMCVRVDAGNAIKPVDAPPETQLFSGSACAENGWHCLTEERLAELIVAAESALEDAEERVEEAEADVEEYERELKMLRGMKGSVAA